MSKTMRPRMNKLEIALVFRLVEDEEQLLKRNKSENLKAVRHLRKKLERLYRSTL